MTWLIVRTTDTYRLFDDRGVERGRCRSANERATHLAFALSGLDTFRRRMATNRCVAHLGMEQC